MEAQRKKGSIDLSFKEYLREKELGKVFVAEIKKFVYSNGALLDDEISESNGRTYRTY